MGLLEPEPGRLPWARGPSLFYVGDLRDGLGYGGEGETGPTLVLYLRRTGAAAWGAEVASAEPTVALGSGRGGNRARNGCSDGDSRWHSSGNSSSGAMARFGAVGRGRIRWPHFGPEAMSSTRLHHGWA